MTDLPKEPTIAPQSDLLGSLFSSWADAWRIGLGVSEMPAGVDVFGAVLSAPAQACWIGFTAWLRYSGAVAEAFARYEASLIQAELDRADEGRGTSPSAGRVLVDETRAFLRRVGDAATLEARRAQHELEQIGELIAQAAAVGDGTSLDHVRRHEIKA
jgi:hypothetical protein